MVETIERPALPVVQLGKPLNADANQDFRVFVCQAHDCFRVETVRAQFEQCRFRI